jgi:predicted DNA-binding transcriptional regulator AlpA
MSLHPNPLPKKYRGHNLLEHGLATVREACAFLKVSRSTIWRYMGDDDNPLPFKRFSRRTIRIPWVALWLY